MWNEDFAISILWIYSQTVQDLVKPDLVVFIWLRHLYFLKQRGTSLQPRISKLSTPPTTTCGRRFTPPPLSRGTWAPASPRGHSCWAARAQWKVCTVPPRREKLQPSWRGGSHLHQTNLAHRNGRGGSDNTWLSEWRKAGKGVGWDMISPFRSGTKGVVLTWNSTLFKRLRETQIFIAA